LCQSCQKFAEFEQEVENKRGLSFKSDQFLQNFNEEHLKQFERAVEKAEHMLLQYSHVGQPAAVSRSSEKSSGQGQTFGGFF